MFTAEYREGLRETLIAAARQDDRICGAAVTGSAAAGREDRWSDIDLALAVAAEADAEQVVADWTARMYREHGAVDHLDVWRAGTLFRVFLLADSLQVDLAFWPAGEFGATSPTFRLVFGTANERAHTPEPEPKELIGTAWLYALHARSSLARGRVLQADYMISNLRNQVLALACVRHGVQAHNGRGLDDLPEGYRALTAAMLPVSLEAGELSRAFRATTATLLDEAGHVDAALAARLTPPVRLLSGV